MSHPNRRPGRRNRIRRGRAAKKRYKGLLCLLCGAYTRTVKTSFGEQVICNSDNSHRAPVLSG